MSGWQTLFLGLIAGATVVMAVVQVRLLVLTAHLAQRVNDLSRQIDRDIKPVLANVTAVSASAARVAAVAVEQTERADRLFADLARRIDETAAVIQEAVIVPARESRAVLAAITASIAAFRGLRAAGRSSRPALDEEDPLFIG